MASILFPRRGLVLLLLVMLLGAAAPLAALTYPVVAATVSPFDLIAAVNGLRAARGMAPLAVNSNLMAAAQAHSNYQASIGNGTHIGPGGNRPIDRARAAGYGGGSYIAIAENITSRRDNTPELINKAVYQDWSDDLHMNTMVNTGLQHIGAGVAVANGIVYLTVDTGWVAGPIGPASPTRLASGTPAIKGPVPTAIPIVELITSTPRQDGSVVHIVGYGQVLVKIAAAYGVKLAEIVAWNSIDPDAIYAGQRLLVRLPSTKTPPGIQIASPTVTIQASPSPSISATSSPPAPSASQSPTDLSVRTSNLPGNMTGEPSPSALLASKQTPSIAELGKVSIQQPFSVEIAILITIVCGVLGVILVSMRRK